MVGLRAYPEGASLSLTPGSDRLPPHKHLSYLMPIHTCCPLHCSPPAYLQEKDWRTSTAVVEMQRTRPAVKAKKAADDDDEEEEKEVGALAHLVPP